MNYLTIALSLLLMGAGELLPNDTKKKYVEKGYSWEKVLYFSNFGGLLAGLITTYTVRTMPAEYSPYFLIIATTVIGYITAQSILTDRRTFLINRNILRVAYISLYILSLYNVYKQPVFAHNAMSLYGFTAMLIIIFIFIPIGASDVRMMAAAIPYVVSIGNYDAIFIFIIVLLVIAMIMYVEKLIVLIPRIKEIDREPYKDLGKIRFYIIAYNATNHEYNYLQEGKKAVGPYMTLSFLIYLIIYPILI